MSKKLWLSLASREQQTTHNVKFTKNRENTTKREKIFVGFADYIGWDISPCILFMESDTPARGNSIAGVAHQQSDVLGKDWTSKITFSSPTTEVLTDGDGKKFKLVEFIPRSIATFTEAMERSLSDQEDEEAEES